MTENIISPPNSAQKSKSAHAAGYFKAVNKVTSTKAPVTIDARTAPFLQLLVCTYLFLYVFSIISECETQFKGAAGIFYEKYLLPNGLRFIIGEIVMRDYGSVTFHYFIIPIIILVLTPPDTKNKTDVMIVNAA